MKGDEGVRSSRGGTTEAIKPRPTDVPKWVEFPSEPDQHTFSEETNCRSKQGGVNKESSWAALTNDENKKGGSCMKRKKQFFLTALSFCLNWGNLRTVVPKMYIRGKRQGSMRKSCLLPTTSTSLHQSWFNNRVKMSKYGSEELWSLLGNKHSSPLSKVCRGRACIFVSRCIQPHIEKTCSQFQSVLLGAQLHHPSAKKHLSSP